MTFRSLLRLTTRPQVWVFGFLSTGCSSLDRLNQSKYPQAGTSVTLLQTNQPVLQASHLADAPQTAVREPSSQTNPFANVSELTEKSVIENVLNRNPTVAQMTAAWQAALARYPQVTSLEDPRVGGYFGPGSINSPNVDFAYRIEVSQAIPYPGKRALRGQNAMSEAAAAGDDLDNTRLQLIELARSSFANYFLASRSNEVGEENLKLLKQFRENALSRYKAGQASQQDVLQAEVAIARQRERLLTLDRQQKVARARLNTLMHLPPDSALPMAPKQLDALQTLPPIAELRASAMERRPDIAALRQRLAADEATVALAQKEYKPDYEVMAAYDKWWQTSEQALRPMVGVRMNLPVRYSRRGGAVSEAMARLAQRRAEIDRTVDMIHYEVQEAYELVAESERVLTLYKETTLPAAKQNAELAVSEYTVGRVPFLNLIEAQRNLVELRDRHYEAMAEFLRRRAVLDRATGVISPTSTLPLPNSR